MSADKQMRWEPVLRVMFIVSMLLTNTYWLYYEFDAAGLDHESQFSDGISYLAMAEGNYDVAQTHRYRPLIPAAASAVASVLPSHSGMFGGRELTQPERLKRGFYVVNFLLMMATAIVLSWILIRFALPPMGVYLGLAIFLSAPTVIYSVATCWVDSGYYLSVVVVVWLTLRGNPLVYLIICPLLLVFKETVLLFLLLPVFEKKFRWYVVPAFLLALGVLLATRYYVISNYGVVKSSTAAGDFWDVVWRHIQLMAGSLRKFFTPRGVNDFIRHGIGPLIFLVPVGLWLQLKSHRLQIPLFLYAMVPIVVLYALLSTSLSRMMFAAFPLWIPLIVLSIITTISPTSLNVRESD
ncbi:MAG: hypothetical protein AAGD11_00125 [Planctomycetota bacterium]